MQAILTEYRGHTEKLPSRIVAKTGNGKYTLSLGANSTPWATDDIRAHKHVAELLRDQLNWKGELIGGGTKNGFAFVFVPESQHISDTIREVGNKWVQGD